MIFEESANYIAHASLLGWQWKVQMLSTECFFRALYHHLDGQFLEIRKLPGGLQQFCTTVDDAVAACGEPDRNVYFSVCLRSAKKGDEDHASVLPAFWVDVDVEEGKQADALQRIQDFQLSPSAVICSGCGVHVYWFLSTPATITADNRPHLRGLLFGLAKALGGDPACRDLSRVMRVPNTVHAKVDGKPALIRNCPDPKPVTVIQWQPQRRYTTDDFAPYFVAENENGSVSDSPSGGRSAIPPRFSSRLKTDTELRNAWEGSRHPPHDKSGSGFDAMLAAMLVNRLFSDDEIASILREYTHGKGSEATTKYLNHTIGNARAFAAETVGTLGHLAPVDSPYRVENGRIGYVKVEGRGDSAVPVFVPLCNFTAEVVEEEAMDDGVEVVRRFVIDGRLSTGQQLPRARVTASQFGSMHWPTEQWGIQPRLSAGMGARDRVREAIQYFSDNATHRHCYAHTGWRQIGGEWRYLHALTPNVQVVLTPPLDRYALPEHPEDVPGSLKLSLDLLDIAPDEVMIPLLAAAYLAPLCEVLHPDFVLFVVGKTGSLKSTLAALILCHYGDFDRTTLPASWESTENALMERLFRQKDVLSVIDDYAPKADAYAQRRQVQIAQRVIRGMG